MSASIGANPNVPHIQQPLADLNALTAVAIQLKQGVDSMGGNRGGQYDRAVTFNDLINLGVLDSSGAVLVPKSITPSFFFTWPANPPGTANTSFIMMGLAQGYTPVRNGQVLILVCGMLGNDSTTTNGQTYAQLYFGTGSAPANGATVPTGAMIAAPSTGMEVPAGGGYEAFALNAVLPSLTAQTPYWIDLALRVNNGNGSVVNLTVIGVEIL